MKALLRTFPLMVFFVALLVGCRQSREQYVESAYPGKFPTSFGATQTTPLGIRVAGPATAEDLERADFVASTVFACLKKNFPSGKLPSEYRCYDGTIVYPPMRDIVVLIGEWQLSCNEDQQVLKVLAPGGCASKRRSEECRDLKKHPCRWRAGFREADHGWFQRGALLHIVTPTEAMFSDTLVRYSTGCWNPWDKPLVRECASPKVPYLPKPSAVPKSSTPEAPLVASLPPSILEYRSRMYGSASSN